MKADEEKILGELRDVKARASMSHFYEHPSSDPDSWIPTYLKEVQILLNCELASANRWMSNHVSMKGSKPWKEEVHARHRVIAIYHQEINLFQQGINVPWFALECGESILAGHWYGVSHIVGIP